MPPAEQALAPTRIAYAAQGHTVMPFRDDIAAVTVPGCVDGWMALHERFGKLPLAEVLEAGRRYAEEGFPASPTLAEDFPAVEGLADAADYTASGPLREGSIVRRPGVARTLAAIAKGGREGFLPGRVRRRTAEDRSGRVQRGRPGEVWRDWVEAISVEAFGAKIWSAPPNSQGYLTLAGAFIASGLDLPSDPDSDALAHLLIESARQAAFDRLDVLAEGVEGAALLDLAELQRRRAAIDPELAPPCSVTATARAAPPRCWRSTPTGSASASSSRTPPASALASSSPACVSSSTTGASASRWRRDTPPSTDRGSDPLTRCARRR
jgi:gamma-glutamyltranspeptidase/glutathione hydrolase